ncbi:uncharacterized protein UMAG_12215 [Mycosarcoma maydis]|uniref:Secreted protein n=1 Tax=Mycosarcoma maydis TaxID=5270 RepID=A0A0D1E247_MYCMD|nr:uncharacterized protein UMAG_12215 [Ustilago maydis 521]KIS68650.1 hypothetical protein UMAG_12215 [Ustilago maydis 521]|eukprot:XP_011389852.1 hypothetical protein UMAG_12215 [Ustilago maydis 521]
MTGLFLRVKLLLCAAVAVIVLLLPAALSAKKPFYGVGPEIGGFPEIKGDLFTFPSPWASVLEQELPGDCIEITPLYVDTIIYGVRTSRSQPEIHFELVGHGLSMAGAQIEPWLQPVNMTKNIILGNNEATAFTMNDPAVAFEITFHRYGGMKFRYLNYDPSTKCFDIMLLRDVSKKYRMTIGKTVDGPDFDTQLQLETRTNFCTDKLVIRIRR